MEAHGADINGPGWVSKLVEIFQPIATRAGRLASIELFHGFRWPELEAIAVLFEEVEVRRGTRLTVQGHPDSRFWLILEGEALGSADARPLRVAGPGDVAGVAGMLYRISSPETTIALGAMRALSAGRAEFDELVGFATFRPRLTALAGDQVRIRRLARLR